MPTATETATVLDSAAAPLALHDVARVGWELPPYSRFVRSLERVTMVPRGVLRARIGAADGTLRAVLGAPTGSGAESRPFIDADLDGVVRAAHEYGAQEIDKRIAVLERELDQAREELRAFESFCRGELQ